MSALEDMFALHLKGISAPDYLREHRFHPKRRWRFDFAWPELMVAVEIEGGTWGKSRHTTGTGFEKDCEKYNNATLLGWSVFRFTGDQVKNAAAIDMTRRALRKNLPKQKSH